MAQEVTFKIGRGSLTTVTSGHSTGSTSTEKTIYTSLSSSDTEEESKIVTSEFLIPLDLPQSSVVKSFQVPMRHSATASETDGSVCTLTVGETEYTLNQDGTLEDNTQFVAHLNNYKTSYGIFPEVNFKIVSTVTRPESDSNYVYVYLSDLICICDIDGGVIVCRPSADVSVGHEIASGFTGVYQLINEEVADDDATYIESYGKEDGEDTEADNRESIVSLKLSLPDKTKVLQIKLIYRASLYIGTSLKSGTAYIEITVSQGEKGNTHINDADYSDSSSYAIYEAVWNEESDLVDAINMVGGEMDLQMLIHTYACGYYNSAKGGVDAYAKLTQAYIEVIYEYANETQGTNLYTKNGEWKQIQGIRRKESGTWIEVSEEECVSILSGNNIILAD